MEDAIQQAILANYITIGLLSGITVCMIGLTIVLWQQMRD